MRAVMLLISFSLLTSAGLAQRPSTRAMSCGQAQDLVDDRGAIVLSTGRHTYDRFVATPGYCSAGEYADRAWAPTRDGNCRLGFVCKPGTPPWEEGLFDW